MIANPTIQGGGINGQLQDVFRDFLIKNGTYFEITQNTVLKREDGLTENDYWQAVWFLDKELETYSTLVNPDKTGGCHISDFNGAWEMRLNGHGEIYISIHDPEMTLKFYLWTSVPFV